jgi:hypothetical protein
MPNYRDISQNNNRIAGKSALSVVLRAKEGPRKAGQGYCTLLTRAIRGPASRRRIVAQPGT